MMEVVTSSILNDVHNDDSRSCTIKFLEFLKVVVKNESGKDKGEKEEGMLNCIQNIDRTGCTLCVAWCVRGKWCCVYVYRACVVRIVC